MNIKHEIIEALHNYGYRCVGKKDTNIFFAKPMGYSFIEADIILEESNIKLEMLVIVKNIDGENLVWTSKMNTLEDIKNREEYYLNVMQIIMDFEASVLEKCFAWQVNRNKRFDFRENTKCLNSLNDF